MEQTAVLTAIWAWKTWILYLRSFYLWKSNWNLFTHLIWHEYEVLSLMPVVFIFPRTITNCNLRTIQARAFAQNPHLRYMWVLSQIPCFSFQIKGSMTKLWLLIEIKQSWIVHSGDPFGLSHSNWFSGSCLCAKWAVTASIISNRTGWVGVAHQHLMNGIKVI